MKGYLPQSYAAATLELVTQGYDEGMVAQALISRLQRDKKLSYLNGIIAEISERISLGDGKRIDVYTAHELSKSAQSALTTRLAKLYNGPVTMQLHLNPDLVGGVILKNGDEVINYSVANLLSELHTFIEQDKE